MMKRVAQLEQANAELRVLIKTRSLKIEALESENFILSSGDAKPEKVAKLKQAFKDTEELTSTVKEMTEFLADYGLTWVGAEGAFNMEQLDKELDFKSPAYRNKLPAEIDTEVLTRRIEELNFIAEKQRIVKNKDGQHQFLEVHELKIFFYKNGLMIDGFPFYPYHSREA